jgi:hypothetical protein
MEGDNNTLIRCCRKESSTMVIYGNVVGEGQHHSTIMKEEVTMMLRYEYCRRRGDVGAWI